MIGWSTAGFEIGSKGGIDVSPLLCAIRTSNGEIVKLLLAHRACFEVSTREAKEMMFEATYNRDAGVLAALLDQGMNLEVRNPDGSHESLLISASQAENISAIKLLLARGARISFKDDANTTALRWAELVRSRMLGKGATKSEVTSSDVVIALLKAHGARDR